MKSVIFDVLHLYYLPQFLPVAHCLKKAGCEVSFLLHEEPEISPITKKALDEEGFTYAMVNDGQEAKAFYANKQPSWIVFGNAPDDAFTQLQEQGIKLAYMQHGIGPKACYYVTSQFPFDVRFVEGDTRKQRLEEMFPDRRFEDVGYAKLDPLFSEDKALQSELTLQSIGLDPTKPTLLYAPTFFPSSIECFSKDWPAEMSEYNFIIKPHFFSFTKAKYAKQRALLNAWSTYDNVYIGPVDCYSLLPFMDLADLMLSEASSTVFEFAALDKPVVWCDFYKVRWSYRGLFKFRMGQRMDQDLALFHDLCEQAKSPKEVKDKVAYCLANPSAKSANRKKITLEMAGKTDGKCSDRITDFILAN